MRNTFIGLGAAAAIIVVIFIISRLIPHPQVAQQQAEQAGPSPQQIAAQATQVGSGFTGTVQIGKWSMSCSKVEAPKPASAQSNGSVPFTLNAGGGSQAAPENSAPAAAPAKKSEGLELGRCRTALTVRPRNNPKTVALVAVVRLLKDTAKDRIVLILHVPPVLKKGGKVIVALTEKEVIGLPVLNCEKGQCIALGVLEKAVYQAILSRPGVAIVVPIQTSGQHMVIPLSMSGLSQSVEAMKRAG